MTGLRYAERWYNITAGECKVVIDAVSAAIDEAYGMIAADDPYVENGISALKKLGVTVKFGKYNHIIIKKDKSNGCSR